MFNLFKKKKPKPELRQFGTLCKADFERFPIWGQCHTFDYDESWYEDTDEETFRPWTSTIPVNFAQGMFLIRSAFKLSDGTILEGFATPAKSESDLGTIQPVLFLPEGQQASFWNGILPPNQDEFAAFYQNLRKGASSVFPIRFSVFPGLCKDFDGGVIEGFYYRTTDSSINVMR